jgi:hypothetical protein
LLVYNRLIDAKKQLSISIDPVRLRAMTHSPYDLVVLEKRAQLWRAEADIATLEEMRSFCLTEADQCERRVELSRSTPVFRETLLT